MPIAPQTSREPVFNLPAVIVVSLAVLVAIHALRVFVLSEEFDFDILINGSVIPARWAVAYGGVPADEVLSALTSGQSDEPSLPLELARYVLAQDAGRPFSGLSYALLHGSWTHVVMNGLWLAAFGTPVARRCGALRFLLLAAAAALSGAIVYTLVHPLQVVPMIGASASVSGMMAAAAWFMFSPPAWMLEGRVSEPHERPRETMAGLFSNRQVLLFLGVWLGINYFSSLFAQPLGVTDASIAWEAHVGGFLAGLLLFPLIDPLPPKARRASA